MNSEWFEKVIKEQIKTCEDVLIGKAKEYATDDDRLHNFKNAAGMMSCDPKEALAGMMAKHTISVYDMCRSGKDYPIELWNEKITDHINYLLLLKAIVKEENSPIGKTKGYLFTDFIKDIWPDYRSQLNLVKYPDGTIPTFDRKPVKIKESDEKYVDKVINSLRTCNSNDCKDCYRYKDNDDSFCTDKLREDAAELLETYKSMLRMEKDTTCESKTKDAKTEIPPVKPGISYRINYFKDQIKRCATAECDKCPYDHSRDCDTSFIQDFEKLITNVVEYAHNEPTFRGTDDGKNEG